MGILCILRRRRPFVHHVHIQRPFFANVAEGGTFPLYTAAWGRQIGPSRLPKLCLGCYLSHGLQFLHNEQFCVDWQSAGIAHIVPFSANANTFSSSYSTASVGTTSAGRREVLLNCSTTGKYSVNREQDPYLILQSLQSH